MRRLNSTRRLRCSVAFTVSFGSVPAANRWRDPFRHFTPVLLSVETTCTNIQPKSQDPQLVPPRYFKDPTTAVTSLTVYNFKENVPTPTRKSHNTLFGYCKYEVPQTVAYSINDAAFFSCRIRTLSTVFKMEIIKKLDKFAVRRRRHANDGLRASA